MEYNDDYDDGEFVWNLEKAKLNPEKHEGVTFFDAKTIWDRPTRSRPDRRHYNEDRFITVGFMPSGVLLVVARSYVDDKIRIISARKATPKEAREFHGRNRD